MKLRQIIISAVGLLLIGLAVWWSGVLASTERKLPPKAERTVPTVFVQTVSNRNTPITVTASGTLEARDRVDLFAEVQGIFSYSSNTFKPGTYYKKGSVLLRINSDEARAGLRAQKSALYNQMVALLPDLRFDCPDALAHWEQYINDFSADKPLPPLPAAASDKEKLFIAGRNINSAWYNVKNLEERLAKYTIYAPFNGILTEALVNKGTLIRPGQPLGSFINPNVYELPVAVNANYADLLTTGKTVTLHNVERNKTWRGTVNRLNSLVNPATQTVQAYIRVAGEGLREGMYLEADLTAKEEPGTFEISRKLLTDNNKVYVVRDSSLELITANPVYFKENTVVMRGLPDGAQLLRNSVPGAYVGMKVKIGVE